MALYFMLALECGSVEADAQHIGDHFQGALLRLASGRELLCGFGVNTDRLNHYWCIVIVEGVNYGSPGGSDHSLTDKVTTTEIGHLLYAHLREAPAFRYAAVGWESEHFREYNEIEAGDQQLIPGFVIADSVVSALQLPLAPEEFRPGYHWFPYNGEN